MPLAIWYLVSAAVHSESLVDDRQYWMTRPIKWRSLFAAKGLFIIAVFHLPLMATDCAVLTAQGFAPAEYLPSLLWRQVVLAIAWILPAAALAAVSKNLAQLALIGFALTALVIAAGPLFVRDRSIYRGSLHWLKSSAIALIAIAAAAFILRTQYARRRTAVSRTVAAVALLSSALFFIYAPWEWAFAVQSSVSGRPALAEPVKVSFVPDKPLPEPTSKLTVRATRTLRLPLRVAGIGDEQEVLVNRLVAQARTAEGRVWRDRGTLPRQESRNAAIDDPSRMPHSGLCTPDSEAVPGYLFLSCRSPPRATIT